MLWKGEGREKESVYNRFVEERQAWSEVVENGQIVIQDIVPENSLGPFGEIIDSGQGLIDVEFTLSLQNLIVKDGPDSVDSVLRGFQIEKETALQKRGRLSCINNAVRSLLLIR